MPLEQVVMIAASVLLVGLLVFIMLPRPPEANWVYAQGIPIWRIPKEAQILEINGGFESRVAELYRQGKLIAFPGNAIYGGVDRTKAKDIAKMRAFKEISEFLGTKVETFGQLVEGQLQAVRNRDELKSIAVSAYKRVTQLFSEAKVAGAYIYAVWEEPAGSYNYLYVLLVYDPPAVLDALKQAATLEPEIKKAVDELGKNGVDFFKLLNQVIEEAKK